MRRTLRGFLGGVVLVFLAATSQAQFGPEGRYRPEKVSALIDRERLNHAERQLRDFARHWQHGRFAKANLDASIGDVQRVIDDNHLSGRERDALWNDVEELRRMREAFDRHEIGNR